MKERSKTTNSDMYRSHLVMFCLFRLFVWILNILVSNKAISWTGPKTVLRAATQRQSGVKMNSVSACHIMLTPTQPVGSRLPQRVNPGPPHQESGALPIELPRHLFWLCRVKKPIGIFALIFSFPFLIIFPQDEHSSFIHHYSRLIKGWLN